jgi:hypothetical protein
VTIGPAVATWPGLIFESIELKGEMGAAMFDIILPSAEAFDIVTDKTERGGNSELLLADVQDGLNFKGEVGAIQGANGPVGFALARFKLRLDPTTSGGTLEILATRRVTVAISIGVFESRNLFPQSGNLNYSASFALNVGRNECRFLWSQLEAKIRGRIVESAPIFQPEWGENFAIQVARSQQSSLAFDDRESVSFDFTVLKVKARTDSTIDFASPDQRSEKVDTRGAKKNRES